MISKLIWEGIGKKAGWMKKAQEIPAQTPIPLAQEKPKPAPFTPTTSPEEMEIQPKEEIITNLRVSLESADTKYGTLTWLVVRGTSPELAQDLKGFGFKPFQNRINGEWEWSLSEKRARELRPQLETYGINCSALDSPPIKKEKGKEVLPVAEHEELEGTDLPPELIGWNKEMQEAKKLSPQDRKKKYSDIIAAALEKMGQEVENPETIAQSQAILKSMLKASSKFHNYSFWNTMMIAIMKPHAAFVASEKAWRKMGRVPKKEATRVPVMFPYTRKLTDQQREGLNDQQISQMTRTRFGMGTTIAYEDTAPIPNWKNDKGEGPFEPPEWQINSNQATQWLTQLYEAAYRWGTEVKKFKIETGATGQAAGYSAGGRIRIGDKEEGVRKVSVLFHELAHELLHWDQDFIREDSTKQEREAEAELVSYVVCSHYHIENKDTPLYLAGYKVNKDLIHARLRNVQKAAVEIFEGTDAMMEQSAAIGTIEQQKELVPETQSKEPTDFLTEDSAKAEVRASKMPFFLNNYIGKIS